jgi:hypothetical protein
MEAGDEGGEGTQISKYGREIRRRKEGKDSSIQEGNRETEKYCV